MDQARVRDQAGTNSDMPIGKVFELCAADMAEVDRLIRASLDSDVVLIRQIAEFNDDRRRSIGVRDQNISIRSSRRVRRS